MIPWRGGNLQWINRKRLENAQKVSLLINIKYFDHIIYDTLQQHKYRENIFQDKQLVVKGKLLCMVTLTISIEA